MDQEVSGFQKTKPFHGHIAPDLSHPTFVWMRRDSCDVNLPALNPNEKENIEPYQSLQGPHLYGEEICSKQQIAMSPNEFSPGRCLFPLGSRSQPIALQNISNGIVTDFVSEIGYSAPTIRSYPQLRFSCAIRTIKLSNSGSVLGLPGHVLFLDPSNFLAINWRCHLRMVSGFTMLATSSRAFLPNCFPMSARVFRSASDSSNRPLIWPRSIRLSATRYRLCESNASLIEPEI